MSKALLNVKRKRGCASRGTGRFVRDMHIGRRSKSTTPDEPPGLVEGHHLSGSQPCAGPEQRIGIGSSESAHAFPAWAAGYAEQLRVRAAAPGRVGLADNSCGTPILLGMLKQPKSLRP